MQIGTSNNYLPQSHSTDVVSPHVGSHADHQQHTAGQVQQKPVQHEEGTAAVDTHPLDDQPWAEVSSASGMEVYYH